MAQNVHAEYMPKPDTITALKDDGYGRRQIWNLVKLFRKNFDGKQFSDIDRKFRDVVRKEPAHKLPKPDLTVGNNLDKERAENLANRSKESHEKAEAAHNIDGDKKTDEEALEFYMRDRH
jgi:hypothetical protein